MEAKDVDNEKKKKKILISIKNILTASTSSSQFNSIISRSFLIVWQWSRAIFFPQTWIWTVIITSYRNIVYVPHTPTHHHQYTRTNTIQSIETSKFETLLQQTVTQNKNTKKQNQNEKKKNICCRHAKLFAKEMRCETEKLFLFFIYKMVSKAKIIIILSLNLLKILS